LREAESNQLCRPEESRRAPSEPEGKKGSVNSSKKSGLWSLALSGISVILILTQGFAVRLTRPTSMLPGLWFFAILTALMTSLACSIGAARGNKLWLLAAIWPVLYTVALCLSIFAE
jgi:hypothetical protein